MCDRPSGVFVRCSSHRAREKMFRALGREPEGYFTLDRRLGEHRGVYLVTVDELPTARAIKGVTKARIPDGVTMMKCWH